MLALASVAWAALALLALLPASVYARPAQQGTGTVTIRKEFETAANDGTIFNNNWITYTVIVNNGTGQAVDDLFIVDVLPDSVLRDVECLGGSAAPCFLIVDREEIPEPLGGTIIVTTTRQITWAAPSLGAGGNLVRSFRGRVVGQSENTEFSNVAFVRYLQGPPPYRDAASEPVTTRVRLPVEQGEQGGLSGSPTWYSSDAGGSLSADWADFDGDGDVDLALGSTLGTSVYRNEAGQLRPFWSSSRRAYGVRWADMNGDTLPDLVVVGEVQDGDSGNIALQPGLNYIYRYDASASQTNRRFVELSQFQSQFQLVRLETADFDGDGDVDVIASTNAINPPCPVLLFPNDGAGMLPSHPAEEIRCISRAATAALRAGDFDNDGDPDLVLGLFPNRVRLLINQGDGFGEIGQIEFVTVEPSVNFLPYDFAWGDFDGDGYLDLAAAYPLLREARIYRNTGPDGAGTYRFERPISLRTSIFLTPYSLDWGDFGGDGRLELAVADAPPRIYSYNEVSERFELFFALEDGVIRGQIWSMRAVDQNGDGDIDLAITDRDGPSVLVSNFRPPLDVQLASITGTSPFPNLSSSSSVTWFDADGDGDLDLLFGAGPSSVGAAALNSRLYFNEDGTFPPSSVRTFSGFGPHEVAVGDVDQDGDLDVAIGTTSEQRLHRSGDFVNVAWRLSEQGEKDLAWIDLDGDGDLELLVATAAVTATGHLDVFDLAPQPGDAAQVQPLNATLVWTAYGGDPRAVAVADFDNDGFLDFAVGHRGYPPQVYRNNGDNSFSVAWPAAGWVPDPGLDTRAVAWADYDRDGDQDLVAGNYGRANVLYENRLGETGVTGVEFTPRELGGPTNTTSLAWGDWDNDKDLDLAVGNYGQPDQIFVNLGSVPGSPQLFVLWSSAESLNTTDVAWGDMENDGDLDLAIAQDGAQPTLPVQRNGIYVNNYVAPSHLRPDNPRATMPLPNQPSYVYLDRPGSTRNAYDLSSAEILSGPDNPYIAINYRLYDPDGARETNDLASPGDPVRATRFEFSTDGGGTWRTALPISSTAQALTSTTGSGMEGTFVWDARANQAIGDDIRFRISIIHENPVGPVQTASTAAISPPFRVRATTCVWPEEPDFQPIPGTQVADGVYQVPANTAVTFVGRVAQGTGRLYYDWRFSDGTSLQGQTVQHLLPNGEHTLNLTVAGEACPQTRPRTKTAVLQVGTGAPDLYLPLVANQAAAQGAAPQAAVEGEPVQAAVSSPPPPLPVTGLSGAVQADGSVTWLRWDAALAPAPLAASGYRIYRAPVDDPAGFEPIADVAAAVTAYSDETAACGVVYYVTALAGGLESPPSIASYATPRCPRSEP